MENNLFDTIKDFIIAFGWTKGVFAIFFFLAHYWLNKIHLGRLNDRQEEINRLAKENREYRKMFLELVDNKLDITDDKQKE